VQRWVSLGKCSRRDAKKKREALLVDARKGELVEPTKVTLGEWLNTWMTEAVKPTSRRHTVACYQLAINKHIAPALGSIGLQSLRPGHLQKYYAEKRSALSNATLSLHHSVVSGALKSAVRQGLVAKNVALLVDGRPRPRRQREEAKRHCWSREEAVAFLKAAKEAGPQLAALFAFALDSGVRRGELLGLRWKDVDLDAATVLIDQQLLESGPEPVFGPTKNGEPRTVDLNDTTVDLLRDHKRVQAESKMRNRTAYHDYGLVFARGWEDVQARRRSLGEPISEGALVRAMEKIIAAADVRRIKVHGLRHTSATLLLAAGEPLHVVSARLGHKDPSITLSIYAHCLPAHQRQAARTMGELLHG
jgi:integrase